MPVKTRCGTVDETTLETFLDDFDTSRILHQLRPLKQG